MAATVKLLRGTTDVELGISLTCGGRSFESMLGAATRVCGAKPTMTKFTQYQLNDLVLEFFNDTGTFKTRSQDILDLHVAPDASYSVCQLRRTKVPHHTYPCTRDHDSVQAVARASFRVHNRVQLVFEEQLHPPDTAAQPREAVRRAYFAYSHQPHVDMTTINKVIQGTASKVATGVHLPNLSE